MPNDTPNPPRPRRRARRASTNDRNGRRLELVTDSWIAELADMAVVVPIDGRAPGRRPTRRRAARSRAPATFHSAAPRLSEMATFVLPTTLTPEGMRTVKNNPPRIHEVTREVEQLGVPVREHCAILGKFDERPMAGSRWSSAPRAPLALARTPRFRSTSSSPARGAEQAWRAHSPDLVSSDERPQ
jgi:hypothetical protein